MIAGMEPDIKPKRRWKTISLRGLLLLVLVIALWLGWIVQKARQQREAVAALQKFGGFVHYNWEFVDGPVKVRYASQLWTPTWGTRTPGRRSRAPVWLRRALGDEYFQSIVHVSLFTDIQNGIADASWVRIGPADDALSRLATQTSVRTLQIGGEQVTDDNLSYVGQMTGLQELTIWYGSHLTDKGFTHLSGLHRLRNLYVDYSKMTDASLETIGKLTNIDELRIRGAGFSDRGLAQLKGLTRLRVLWLGEGKHAISDAGLGFLKGMKGLEHLDVEGWHVSDAGLAELRELKNLKSLHMGVANDYEARRKRLQELLPGITISGRSVP
jgi:hypothetical protein